MSSTAPLTSPAIATSAKGTRNQVGRIVVRAPIGSEATALDSLPSEAHSSTPYPTRISTGRLPPTVGQPTTPRVDAERGR